MSESNFSAERPSTHAWSQTEPTPSGPRHATQPYPVAPNFFPPQPEPVYPPPQYPPQRYVPAPQYAPARQYVPVPQYYPAPQPVVVQHTVVMRRRTPHVLHCFLTLITGGLWLPVWIIDAIRR